jgi:hypothetical protein
MKKMKLFFVSTVLTLITVGVFAGRSHFAVSMDLYADVGGTKVEITNGSQSFLQLTLTGGTGVSQAEIKNRNGISRLIYHFNGTTYVPVYATNAF